MENRTNTSFYEVIPTSLSKFKKRDDCIVFRCRMNEEDCNKWTELFGKTPVRKPIGDRAMTTHFNFTQLEYDNRYSKDEVVYHGNVFTTRDRLYEVKDILNENFENVSYIHKGKSISTTISYTNETVKGVWKPIDENTDVTPHYPVCIVSYSRANEVGYTHLLLTKLKVRHYLFIERQQVQQYENWYNPEYCELVLGDNFSQQKMGSTPMRNYILNYFDVDYVWMLDDNIKHYNYFNKGRQNQIESGVIFRFIEDYVNTCSNVGIASHNFNPFVAQGCIRRCLIVNGKCYSSMLINTRVGLSFKHRHQEDNFISIESICKGYNTLCFNTVLYDKNTSGKDKGGNHDDIYKCGDNTDGDGYRERYEYFVNTARELIKSGDITLNTDDVETFVWRDYTMNGKEYHAKAKYHYLLNHDNKLQHNDVLPSCFDDCIRFVPT